MTTMRWDRLGYRPLYKVRREEREVLNALLRGGRRPRRRTPHWGPLLPLPDASKLVDLSTMSLTQLEAMLNRWLMLEHPARPAVQAGVVHERVSAIAREIRRRKIGP
jgi:hypothetical protein